jgi:hypothetical protein
MRQEDMKYCKNNPAEDSLLISAPRSVQIYHQPVIVPVAVAKQKGKQASCPYPSCPLARSVSKPALKMAGKTKQCRPRARRAWRRRARPTLHATVTFRKKTPERREGKKCENYNDRNITVNYPTLSVSSSGWPLMFSTLTFCADTTPPFKEKC